MPNPLLLVDTTGAVLPAGTDYKTHLSDEAIDYAYLPDNFHPSNVEAKRFYYHCGILCHELLGTLPTVDEPRTIHYRPITLVSGATDCPPTNGYLGATVIRGHSLRFFVELKCTFLLSTYGTSSVLPIPNQSDGTCWKEETRNLMVVDQPTGTAYGDLITQWDSDIVKVGTIHYESGTVNIYGGQISFSHYRPTFGPDFAVLVTVAGVQTNRVYTWKQLVKLDIQRQGGAPVGGAGNGVLARMLITAAGTNLTAVKYATSSTAEDEKSVNVVLTSLGLQIPTAPNSPLTGVSFKVGNTLYTSLPDGTLVTDFNPVTGTGTTAGAVDLNTGAIQITNWLASASATVSGVHAAAPYGTDAYCDQITIRTASAPLRPGSLSIVGSTKTFAGLTHSFNVSADLDGNIVDDWVLGKVDYANGIVRLWFTQPTSDVLFPINLNTDLRAKDYSFLEIPGVAKRLSWHAKTSSLRYNAVAYSYLPLDADLLGIDPVRLPSDGRVPIFRPGSFVVVGHKGEVTATVSNAQTIDCARVRLSRVRVIGNDGVVINTGYTADLEAGTVTFTDVSGYSQPVTVEHRIEDMMMTSDVQINGQLTFTRPLSHDYPLGSYVSSALIAGGNGDMFARVSVMFDQATWNGTFADAISGSAATGTFNSTQYPIVVTNRGARTERWAVQFTSGTTFNVIGENVGVIATGSVNSNCLPINPATNVPYFTIPALGWGAGWSAGNVLRFNTVGAEFPVWVVRTVQQGPETVPDDSFTLLIRGDVNTP